MRLAGGHLHLPPAARCWNGRCCCRWPCRATSSPSPISTCCTPLGPVQEALRAMLGIASPRGLRLPDVRSTGGCILVLSAVLYPYVYLSARASFVLQSAAALEVARTAGRQPLARLPAHRPAAGPPGHRGGPDLGAAGGAGRHRRLRIPRRAHPHRLHLFDLGEPLEPARRGADRPRHARPRAGTDPAGAMGAARPAVRRHRLGPATGAAAADRDSGPRRHRFLRPAGHARLPRAVAASLHLGSAADGGDRLSHPDPRRGRRHRRPRRRHGDPRPRPRPRGGAGAAADARAARLPASRGWPASAMRYRAPCSPSACSAPSPASTTCWTPR